MKISILTGFDGSCPHWPEGVTRQDDRTFVLRPSHRKLPGVSEEAPGMGSRFSTRIMNSDRKTLSVTIIADWETAARTCHHDLGYVRHGMEKEWTMIPGQRNGATVEYRLDVRPGVTHLGLYPEYNYEQCRKFIVNLKRRGVDIRAIGQSREKRDLWLICLPSSNPAAVNFLLQVRDHAYETAGSYCAEGVVDFLLSGDALSQYLCSKFNVFIAPMTNPDGVYNGMSRLTWEKGADLNRVHTVADEAHTVLKHALDEVCPAVYMNIHNWTDKFMDGLLCNEQTVADLIRRHMPDDTLHYKHWFVQTLADWLNENKMTTVPDKYESWKGYCREQFGAMAVCCEFPWFALDTAAMRKKGVQAFISLALTAIEERKL